MKSLLYFHLLVLVNEVEFTSTHGFTLSEAMNKTENIEGLTSSQTLNHRTFNDSIGIKQINLLLIYIVR